MGSSTTYQYLAIICANLCALSAGSAFGWTSSAFLVLETDQSPLASGALTTSELAWVGMLIGIGGVIGTIVVGWMCETCGRKWSLLFMAMPMTASWVLIIFATNPWYLYISRLCAGFASGGVYVAIPLLVGEISEDSIRGALGSIITLFANAGILLGFLAGHYLSYEAVPQVLLSIPVIFMILYIYFPESPWYLIRKNRVEEAEKSMRFYRNITDHSDKDTKEAFEKELSIFKSTYQVKSSENEMKITFGDFFCRPLFICLGIMITHDFCGAFTMINYTGKIFADSGSKLPPNESAVVVGVIQLIGTYVSTLFVDRVGRKLLFSLSCIGTGLSHVVLATYIYCSTSLGMDLEFIQWVPVVSFSAVLFIASCGILPIPYIVLGEMMPNKIRGPATVVCLILGWLETAVFVKFFPLVAEMCGLHGCIYLFAIFCFLGLIYTIVFVPETRGKSLADIEKSFNK